MAERSASVSSAYSLTTNRAGSYPPFAKCARTGHPLLVIPTTSKAHGHPPVEFSLSSSMLSSPNSKLLDTHERKAASLKIDRAVLNDFSLVRVAVVC
jgi:hypothetical protein